MGHFKPEFINRLDDTMVFKPLTKEDLVKIAELELKKLYKRTGDQYEGMTVDLTEEFKKKLLEEGYDPEFGARPLRRAIARLVQGELSSSIMMKSPTPNEKVVLDVDANGKVVVNRAPEAASTPEEKTREAVTQ